MKKRTNFIATASVNSLSLPSHADGQSLHLRVRYCHLMAWVQGAGCSLQPERLCLLQGEESLLVLAERIVREVTWLGKGGHLRIILSEINRN